MLLPGAGEEERSPKLRVQSPKWAAAEVVSGRAGVGVVAWDKRGLSKVDGGGITNEG